jgi:hypothetical protein
VPDDDNLSSNPDNFHFQCPARSCGSVFDVDEPYSTFVTHVSTHALELFTLGRFRNCYFGCREGFIDELQRRRHTMHCPSYEQLHPTNEVASPCPAEGCIHSGTDHAAHWSCVHNPEAYSDLRNTYRDDCCQKAWMDPHVFYRHITSGQLTRGTYLGLMLSGWEASQLRVYEELPVIGHYDVSGAIPGPTQAMDATLSSRPPRNTRRLQLNQNALGSRPGRVRNASADSDVVPDILQTMVWPTTDVWPTPLDAT